MVGGEDPRWWRADPPGGPGEPALVQDPTGGLWLRDPRAEFVSLPLGEVVPAEDAMPRAGVVSPTGQMLRDRALGYRRARGDDAPAVFVVDVPLASGHGIGFASDDPGARPGGPAVAGAVRAVELLRTEVVPASADLVVRMIRRAGYRPGGQVIQFLAAPADEVTYGAFRAQAQEVADQVDGDVYIVSAAGATVVYDADRQGFAALLADGRPAGWKRLSPPGHYGTGEREQRPGYYEGDEHGILILGTELPSSVEGSEREQPQAVPPEAGTRGGGRPGLELPVLTQSPEGYTDLLRGAPPALAVGDEFSLTHDALAFVSNRFSGHNHYVIARPVARALPQPVGAIMFGRDSSFIVTGITGEGGPRVIWLRHPGEDAPPPSGDAHGEPPAEDAPGGPGYPPEAAPPSGDVRGEPHAADPPGGRSGDRPAGSPTSCPCWSGSPSRGCSTCCCSVTRRASWAWPGTGGGFVPLSRDSLAALPEGTHEVRLVLDDGEEVRAAAAVLAEGLGVPVWVTPAGAGVRVEDGQLVAVGEGGPASWVQVLPPGRPAARPGILPWYDTGQGMVQARRGEAVVELDGGGDGGVDGIILASHREYNAFRAGPGLVPRVPGGLFAVGADIVPGEDGPVFVLPDFDGGVARRPLGDLLELLREHGWTDGRAIVVLGGFSEYAGEDADQDWDALTGGLAGLAEAAGASVLFPGRGSGTVPLDGGARRRRGRSALAAG